MAGPTPQQGNGAVAPSIPADPDFSQWADLAKEVGDADELLDDGEDSPREIDEDLSNIERRAPAEKREEKAEAKEGEGDEKPKPTYEQLETHYRNNQQALREAREAAKEAREQIANFTRMVEALRENRQQRPAVQEPPAAPQPKAPTLEEDPIGYFKHELAQRDQAIEELKRATSQGLQQTQQQQAHMAFADAVKTSEVEMRKKAPDYDAACEYLESGRIRELEKFLPDTPQVLAHARAKGFQSVAQMRAQILNADRLGIARHALETGRSPAEVYYEIAQSRGFTTKPAANGSAAPSADVKKAEEKIDMARRGQKASRSAGSGGGGADNPFNADELADLAAEDPEAFDKAWEQARKSGKLG